MDLTPEVVSRIAEDGGTILGTSRGSQDPDEIVDCLERLNLGALFVIGGDGTLRGAMTIAERVRERGGRIAVVGIPKTIDNDIPYIDQSFGFQTAFAEATKSIRSAHVEAKASPNGVGLVKLMGRHSGFIACYAALAEPDANYVLIPEVPFALDGPGGFLAHLARRVRDRDHAVIVVAEGAGQDLVPAEEAGVDASGNKKLHDIGLFLRRRISDHFAAQPQIHRSELCDPERGGQSVRQRLLHPPGPKRGARGPGRPHGDRDRPLAWPLRAHPAGPGREPPQPGLPGWRSVAVGARGDGAAADIFLSAWRGLPGSRPRAASRCGAPLCLPAEPRATPPPGLAAAPASAA